jgi:hypothetical protein
VLDGLRRPAEIDIERAPVENRGRPDRCPPHRTRERRGQAQGVEEGQLAKVLTLLKVFQKTVADCHDSLAVLACLASSRIPASMEKGSGEVNMKNGHAGAPGVRRRHWTSIHHSPLFWVGVFLCLAAITVYVWSDDLSWTPRSARSP